MAEPAIAVVLIEEPDDPRFGDLHADDGQGGTIEGEVATGPMISERFRPPWPDHPRALLLQALDAPTAWLFKLKVPKDVRSRGRGTALMRATLSLLRARGVRYVALAPRPETMDDRDRLIAFYERLGFEKRADYMVADLQKGRQEAGQ